MDVVYLKDQQQFITIPDGDIATHEQIMECFRQREIERQKQYLRQDHRAEDVFKYFEF